jgi:hypothetical protein
MKDQDKPYKFDVKNMHFLFSLFLFSDVLLFLLSFFFLSFEKFKNILKIEIWTTLKCEQIKTWIF